MDEKISKLFLPLLDKLYNTEPAGEPFRQPVDPIKYGCYDYYLYVNHPIDLSTIRQKLVTRQYRDAWRFIADIELMFKNAYLFNKKGTAVYEFTNKLKKIWNSELTSVMQKLNYCCGNLHQFGPQLLFCHGTTPDRYCQIAVGARYKIFEDSYSFCIPCFNRIETEYVSLQTLTCETTRMNLPTQPVKKSDFSDCTNDRWQYESFIQCTQCCRRVHQICDLFPTHEEEVKKCKQHEQIEREQREQCHVPPDYEVFTRAGEPIPETLIAAATSRLETEPIDQQAQTNCQITSTTTEQYNQTNHISNGNLPSIQQNDKQKSAKDHTRPSHKPTFIFAEDEMNREIVSNCESQAAASQTSLDDELLQFARHVDGIHNRSAPGSPNPDENLARFDSATNSQHKDGSSQVSDVGRSTSISRGSTAYTTCSASSNPKNSVDNIAARLSINKLSAENQSDGKQCEVAPRIRDKFVCNHCYRKERLGFNLRHRRYSARRLPHTRMSRYIETKVNEHIRENSPTAGEMTIRVLTAYRDKVHVKNQMRDYIERGREQDPTSHPNLEDYPGDFAFTTRAIFAWQEIDGVDVCVFGMHVQEYGDDCPEPNRQVVYLSYLDSVHFFRPKQFRTAVYHEILLSYFKYVKKLGFRRVFIWVCPSRKGDDYIFYRHPSEQKMPTLKRLSDWYVHLLDKGVVNGIVERHQNIYEYAMSESWTSILSMPYLSGDYWPGEFERLLKFMIESKKKYDQRMSQKQEEFNDFDQIYSTRIHDISDHSLANNYIYSQNDRSLEQHNILSLSNLYQKSQQNSTTGKSVNLKSSLFGSIGLKPAVTSLEAGDFNPASIGLDEIKFPEPYTPSSSRSDDQPLDLSKSNSIASPDSIYDDDQVSDASCTAKEVNPKKRRRKSSATMGYTKKRNRNAKTRASQSMAEASNKYASQKKSGSQSFSADLLLSPEEELIKNLERSLKRQREGFIVVRLSECDCSPYFESQRRKEEKTFSCDLMKGREPFLQLARLKNYEFSSLRRAKFSSLAMVRHLGESFKLEPICYECFSFDTSKRHYACDLCEDYYLCTSCHEIVHHQHAMSLLPPSTQPDIDEFLSQCAANSISSASSTISNKSCNETSLETTSTPATHIKRDSSPVNIDNGHPLNRQQSNSLGSSSSMPLGCKRQRNWGPANPANKEDLENSKLKFDPFTSSNKSTLAHRVSPPPSHSQQSNSDRTVHIELDQVLIEHMVRQAGMDHDIDFDEMKGESKKLLAHYFGCPIKDTCLKCKFVVYSMSFMSVLMRSERLQMMINCSPSDNMALPSNTTGDGINLTKNRRFG